MFVNKEIRWMSKSEEDGYAEVSKSENGQIEIQFYNPEGKLKRVSQYSFFGKERQIKEGVTTYYYPNGADSLICNYTNDKIEGPCYTFYPDGKPQLIISYKNDLQNGFLVQYYPSGQLRRKEYHEDGKCLGGKLFAETGEELEFYPYEIMPEFPGGEEALSAYITRTLRYPVSAVENGIMGRVITGFSVDEEGKVCDIVIRRGVSLELNSEAVRVLEKMAEEITWTPGKLDGKLVKVKYITPIVFRLQ
jgi:protein TonB